MPMTLSRDDERRRFTAVATGLFNLEEVRAAMAEWRSGPYEDYTMLFDAREARTDLTSAQLQATAKTARAYEPQHGRRGRVAIVATEPAMFGVARMYEAWSQAAGLSDVRAVRRSDTTLAPL